MKKKKVIYPIPEQKFKGRQSENPIPYSVPPVSRAEQKDIEKILLGELLVEYILAFFISLVIGYITERIPFLRKVCVVIMK